MRRNVLKVVRTKSESRISERGVLDWQSVHSSRERGSSVEKVVSLSGTLSRRKKRSDSLWMKTCKRSQLKKSIQRTVLDEKSECGGKELRIFVIKRKCQK